MFQEAGLPQLPHKGAQPAVADGKKRRKPRYPVVTLVLYFGEERWNKHRRLLDGGKAGSPASSGSCCLQRSGAADQIPLRVRPPPVSLTLRKHSCILIPR